MNADIKQDVIKIFLYQNLFYITAVFLEDHYKDANV
jgi:hypothetical protein